jgi:hypothetical protein
MTTTTESWTEFHLVGIQAEGESEIQFAAFAEDITAFEYGERNIEGVPLLNGGHIVKKNRMGDETITMKVYPVGVNKGDYGINEFLGGTAATGTDPYTVLQTNARKRHRIVVLSAASLPNAPTVASGTVSGAGLRDTVINAYCTKVTNNFDDKHRSAEITFKWAPFDRNGLANRKGESTNTTGLGSVTATPTSW